MRLFIAVSVPEELKERIKEVQSKLAGISDIRLVEKKNLHFTIKFLGETDMLENIENCMKKALEGLHQFDIEIAGIDAFPSGNYVRVVWFSVGNGLEEFKRMMKSIDTGLSKIGFEQEEKYVPHLTIARVRSGSSSAELVKLLEVIEKTEIGTMHLKELKLVNSTLTRAGPVYEEVYSVKLK